MSARALPALDVLLCERCGYPLHDPADGAARPVQAASTAASCPECGLPIAASSPACRRLPTWQLRPSPATLLATLAALVRSPRAFFRGLAFTGGNNPARGFLLAMAMCSGVLAGVNAFWLLDRLPVEAWLIGMVATQGVLMLSVIEMLGVAFFSRRRGWRVPLRHAERLVCYASAAWIPTVALLSVFLDVLDRIDPQRLPRPSFVTADQATGILMLALFALALCCFESVVYLGVRQARFANMPPPGAASSDAATDWRTGYDVDDPQGQS